MVVKCEVKFIYNLYVTKISKSEQLRRMRMKNKKYLSVIIGLIGICLWIIYIFEKEMSNYGIYTLVNYSVHEILSIVPFLCILATIALLFIWIKDSIKHKNFKSHIAILLLLSVSLLFQGNYVISQSNTASTSTVAKVVNIDSQKKEIVISNELGEVVLDCPMTIFMLLEVDKEYLISYLHEKEGPSKGKVNLVQIIGD